jgi:hypothetical protein
VIVQGEFVRLGQALRRFQDLLEFFQHGFGFNRRMIVRINETIWYISKSIIGK